MNMSCVKISADVDQGMINEERAISCSMCYKFSTSAILLLSFSMNMFIILFISNESCKN